MQNRFKQNTSNYKLKRLIEDIVTIIGCIGMYGSKCRFQTKTHERDMKGTLISSIFPLSSLLTAFSFLSSYSHHQNCINKDACQYMPVSGNGKTCLEVQKSFVYPAYVQHQNKFNLQDRQHSRPESYKQESADFLLRRNPWSINRNWWW